MKNILTINDTLSQGEFIISENRMYRLLMQPDGNLVLYDIFDNAEWSAKTRGKGGVRFILQEDGNLVIYTKENKPVWQAKTKGKGGNRLIIQDDRNLVLYDEHDKAIWSTKTAIMPEVNKKHATTWMQDNLKTLGDKKLSEICIAGSHDSGMYKRTVGGTIGAYDCNTLTQSTSILGQLCYGARYFDIRPVIAKGKFYTGHYTTKFLLGTFGANGASLETVINDINIFNKYTGELIILNLSHAFNTDVGRAYRDFNQSEWDSLFKQLSEKVNNLFSIAGDLTDLITNQTLNTFIGDGKPAVVIIVEPQTVDIGKYCNKGFYPYKSCNVINEYSNTNKVNKMINEQIAKMNEHAKDYFLLSWTLTQDGDQVISCHIPKVGGASIKQLAIKAREKLQKVKSYITPVNKPNIIYIDDIVSSVASDLAMEINNAPVYKGNSILQANHSLQVNEYLASPNGAYKLLMQPDGNLVIYNIFMQAVWSAKTRHKGGVRLRMQGDGNLVIYTKDNKPVWQTKTNGSNGIRLVLQSDRNLVIYNDLEQAVWNTKTSI